MHSVERNETPFKQQNDTGVRDKEVSEGLFRRVYWAFSSTIPSFCLYELVPRLSSTSVDTRRQTKYKWQGGLDKFRSYDPGLENKGGAERTAADPEVLGPKKMVNIAFVCIYSRNVAQGCIVSLGHEPQSRVLRAFSLISSGTSSSSSTFRHRSVKSRLLVP